MHWQEPTGTHFSSKQNILFSHHFQVQQRRFDDNDAHTNVLGELDIIPQEIKEPNMS